MRARNIKPGFFKNEELAECEPLVRILFEGLWCYADREGKFEWRPKRIKAEILPYDNVDINGYLTELQQRNLVKRYSVNGTHYGQVVNFLKHQHPHHTEKDSEIPNIPLNGEIPVKNTVSNRDNPSDSLIPDSLIPDSKRTQEIDYSQLQEKTDNICRTLSTHFKQFNFYSWRQEQINNQRHPEAIEECLQLLWKARKKVKKVRPYITQLMKIKGPNPFEREEIKKHEERKNFNADIL